ncbi:hypothetical protein F5879DRAFT_804336 [Lentinula edodes]|uniref:Uncharacterized protein n=2 Tax=Lentinula TaxID=5352 RepID=A0A1Q3EPN4_LENED|nr:uncharacterized protein C8R40DRAFT_1040899 [Lentinula edodes]KAJ3869049.1 hypothetical protein EV359DRAFT_77121 [Lentinula novae-zelandiae]KAJ3935957.1 MAG: hypothetical protein NXY57DRAFT_957731 [Lentinula lateritia]KAH7877239.1 hypothetical protein C8R40DRAFT_1040899 [Lentinula edodes]KAJ3881047.1 hypothetical protein F5051DRAFT_322576 [Lentinula edodes]KAJ3893212.1 hypothetical protein GG344DRAFT_43721 [Lentinula edodes]
MSMLANILGFSLFGLAARFGQLGIQKRNLFENLGGHALAMGVFGYGGYMAYRWDQTAAFLIEKKKAEIAESRKSRLAKAEALEAKLMAEKEEH